MSKSALVTGAAGFIGQHLVERLDQDGWRVTGLDLKPKPAHLSCSWVQGSILDHATLKQAMKGCGTVFHLAAMAHLSAPKPSKYDEINVGGTRAVIDVAQKAGVSHLVATSSAVLWQVPDITGVVDETTPLPPVNALAGPYARSKWRANALLQNTETNDLAVTRLFPTIPVGAGDDAMTAPTQMLSMFLNKPPPAVLETTFNFVSVGDVARAHVLAAQNSPQKQKAYIVSGERWTMDTLLEWLRPYAPRNLPRKKVPYAIAYTVASIAEPLAHLSGRAALSSVEGVRLTRSCCGFSSAALENDFGWKREPIENALKEAIEWLQQRGEKN